MAQLLDIFGFPSVLLRGLVLALNTLVGGGTVYAFWILRSSSRRPESELWRCCQRLLWRAAAALAIVQFGCVAPRTPADSGLHLACLFNTHRRRVTQYRERRGWL